MPHSQIKISKMAKILNFAPRLRLANQTEKLFACRPSFRFDNTRGCTDLDLGRRFSPASDFLGAGSALDEGLADGFGDDCPAARAGCDLVGRFLRLGFDDFRLGFGLA
jgi:hypothetical protein